MEKKHEGSSDPEWFVEYDKKGYIGQNEGHEKKEKDVGLQRGVLIPGKHSPLRETS